MSREEVSYEKKYQYLLYRVQKALIEMNQEPKSHRGRRHLENGLISCEGHEGISDILVTYDEMTQ